LISNVSREFKIGKSRFIITAANGKGGWFQGIGLSFEFITPVYSKKDTKLGTVHFKFALNCSYLVMGGTLAAVMAASAIIPALSSVSVPTAKSAIIITTNTEKAVLGAAAILTKMAA